jgi:hypothetical protein
VEGDGIGVKLCDWVLAGVGRLQNAIVIVAGPKSFVDGAEVRERSLSHDCGPVQGLSIHKGSKAGIKAEALANLERCWAGRIVRSDGAVAEPVARFRRVAAWANADTMHVRWSRELDVDWPPFVAAHEGQDALGGFRPFWLRPQKRVSQKKKSSHGCDVARGCEM